MQAADVYFNLHRRVWSLRCRSTGRVTGHSRVVAFPFGARLIVRKAGRERVLRTGQKVVHAFVRGDVLDTSGTVAEWMETAQTLPNAVAITYNPFHAAHFTHRATGERIDAASAVLMIAPEGQPPQVWAIPA